MSPGHRETTMSEGSDPKKVEHDENETKLDLTSSDDLKGRRLDRNEAKKLAVQILKSGEVIPTGHCFKRLAERSMDLQDVSNILRAGTIGKEPEPNMKFDTFRYTIETGKMGIVIEFIGRKSLRVITAWRKK